jgi:hypothetical protein
MQSAPAPNPSLKAEVMHKRRLVSFFVSVGGATCEYVCIKILRRFTGYEGLFWWDEFVAMRLLHPT